MVLSEGFLRLTFLTGCLECLLGPLGDSYYLLASVLRPLYFVLSKYGFTYNSDDAQSLHDTSLPPLPCFSEAELDFVLFFSLLLSLLS